MRKSPIKRKSKSPRNFTDEHYNSNDGMLTSVWGPTVWFTLHTISFNYPINPDIETKKNYRNYVLSLQNVLPCRYCRENLKKNFEKLPLTMANMKNRDAFSRYIYNLHEVVNEMLGKKSGLSYEDVRDMYENFRSRCLVEKKKSCKSGKKKHSGCTEPFYGKKSKCIIKIVPKDHQCETFQIHKKCVVKKK